MPENIGYARPGKIRSRLSKDMAEKLKGAQTRLLVGQRFRQKEREVDWIESYNQYMAKDRWQSYSTEDKTADLVNINVSKSTIDTLVPFVADEDPNFIVEPDSVDASEQDGVVLGTFMNRIWRSKEVNGKIALADGVFDYLVLGDGFMKPGYEIVDRSTYDENGNVVGEGRVKVAEFTVDRISSWDVWIDPYSDGLHNARWVCHRLLLPVHEMNEDERYKLAGAADFQGTHFDDNYMSPEDRERTAEFQDWMTVYEFYDIKERWMMAFLPGGNTPVRYVEEITNPIIQIPNYRIPNSPYHMGELEHIRSLQLEINKTRSQMMTHRRRNVMKWVINEARLTEDAIEAMKSAIVNDVIRVETNEPIENIIQAIAPQPLSQDSYAIDDRLRADVNELTGVNEYLRGTPQNISRTATEASIIEGATNTRTRHKLLQVELAAKQAGQVLLDIIRDVLPLTRFEEMTMFVTGKDAERLNRTAGIEPQTQPALLTPNPEVFKGRYRVEVERGSTELRNPQVKAQQLMQMTQMMMGATEVLQLYGVSFNLKRMLEMWFEAEGIKNIEELFEQDEQQAAGAQLAIQERQAGIAAQQQSGAGPPGGTPAGQPNRATAQPPSELINAGNSGTLPPSPQ